MEIYLCDDRMEELERYRAKLLQLAQTHQIPVEIVCFHTGQALCFALEEKEKMPDLIYLDILMGKENGITTGSLLRRYGYNSLLIYLTTSQDYAISSFDTHPFYYLVKDLDAPERFERVFLEAVAEIQKGRSHSLAIKVDGAYTRVLPKDIFFLEVYGHTTVIHTQKQDIPCRLSLDEAELQLKDFFFVRVHRSFLINPSYIVQIEANWITLTSGAQIPMSRKYSRSARKAVSAYLLGESC